MKQERLSASIAIALSLGGLAVLAAKTDAVEYKPHDPIVVDHVETSPDAPYVIEGFEITNPDGPGIQVLHVDHVVIRNNYVHDCGTKISKKIQDKVKATGDARLSMMSNPRQTGAINVFDAKTVVISGNRVINNDYGIRVWGHNKRADQVVISDNQVRDNHRAFFVWVTRADSVEINDNRLKDNGLSLFIDNEALIRAFAKGKDYGDGRATGIVTDGCSNVRIHGNTVINSNGDGILVSGETSRGNVDSLARNIAVYNNTVVRNAEQGILFSSARHGKVYGNTIRENAARSDTTGGSSGIMFEANVQDFEVYDNEICFNDVFGITIILSTGISIRDNHIHHNGDGAIGWGKFFHPQAKVFDGLDLDRGIAITGNNIHHNRVAVFGFFTDQFSDKVKVENNRISRNGGQPIHYEQYGDHSTSTHPEDWEYDEPSVLLTDRGRRFVDCFSIQTNTIDGEEVPGYVEAPAQHTVGALEMLMAAAAIIAAPALLALYLIRRRRRPGVSSSP
jgi:parallel beta-helix repeat protein